MGITNRARLQELFEAWSRLENLPELQERRRRYQRELEAVSRRLFAFADDHDLTDDESLRVMFSTHATATALVKALERLEASIQDMDLEEWALPRFSKP